MTPGQEALLHVYVRLDTQGHEVGWLKLEF